jgi:hypothetical protein
MNRSSRWLVQFEQITLRGGRAYHSLSGLDTAQGRSKSRSDHQQVLPVGGWSTPRELVDVDDPKSRQLFGSVAKAR